MVDGWFEGEWSLLLVRPGAQTDPAKGSAWRKTLPSAEPVAMTGWLSHFPGGRTGTTNQQECTPMRGVG